MVELGGVAVGEQNQIVIIRKTYKLNRAKNNYTTIFLKSKVLQEGGLRFVKKISYFNDFPNIYDHKNYYVSILCLI